jgi:hypothetical protein
MYLHMQIINDCRRIRVFLLSFALGPVARLPPELIRKYEAYTHLIGPLGQEISPAAKPLPTQEETNTKETRTDIHASSGMRTHDPSV